MERADKNLAFMLRYENVAWYEAGKVRVLDRRVYPAKTEFVICESTLDVAKAIKDITEVITPTNAIHLVILKQNAVIFIKLSLTIKLFWDFEIIFSKMFLDFSKHFFV